MKRIGLIICIVGTIAAILFPPYRVLGQAHWGFILSDIVSAFGHGVPVYKHIDETTLLIELIAINAVGIALRFWKA
ncbi:MAG TPA: hypothetical protein VNH42_01710 [Mariprofundaceae bacterium]|nr:hypothetical protein [Mariprofundaceae bacterium]